LNEVATVFRSDHVDLATGFEYEGVMFVDTKKLRVFAVGELRAGGRRSRAMNE